MKLLSRSFIVITLLLSAACETISYGDAQAVETTTIEFGSTDLQQTSAKMVDSLLSFPPIVQITSKKRPVVFIDNIKNKTLEHIDTESVTDTISTRLLRSGKFRFVDMTKLDAVKRQLNYQTNSGLVNQQTAVKVGRMIGAEYMLYGNLSSINKKNGSKRDVYYKFTLKLMHLETGLIEWQDEKEIRKTRNKSLLGL